MEIVGNVCAAINVPAAHTSAQVAIFIFYSFPFLTFPAFFTFPMMAPIHEKRVADNAATLFSCVLMAPVPFYGCFCGASAFYLFTFKLPLGTGGFFDFPVGLEAHGEVWWVLLEVLLHGDGNVGTEEVGTHVECQERVL